MLGCGVVLVNFDLQSHGVLNPVTIDADSDGIVVIITD
jgi:hypothetical protein